jgi:coenzyme PQQ biosynthesis protein PqqD
MSGPITEDATPRLVRGVRLHEDRVRGAWVLLAPESMIEANPVAVEILKRCDGARTIAEIVTDLATVFNAPRDVIEADVMAFLSDLSAKRLIRP